MRLRGNFLSGTLLAGISNVATTITSTQFAALPAVAAPDYLPLVLDPLGAAGNPEIVKVTAHTASSTTVTVERGQEGTVARSHLLTTWRHGPTVLDFLGLRHGEVSPFEFGAVSGSDNRAAFQSTIDACIGAGDPTVVGREPLGSVVLPAFMALIGSTGLTWRSVRGLDIKGPGMRLGGFKANADMTTLLDLNGVAYCDLEKFGLSCASGVDVTYLLLIHQGAGTALGCTTNKLSRLHAEAGAGTWVVAFAFGTDATNAVDSTVLDACAVSGGWTDGNTATFQYGAKFGNDSAGNVVANTLRDFRAYSVRYGVHFGGASGQWIGGQVSGVECVATGLVVNRHVLLQALRAEYAQRLWQCGTGGGSGAMAIVKLDTIDFHAQDLHADTRVIDHRMGGELIIDGVDVIDAPAPPTIYLATQATSRLVCIVNALRMQTPIEDAFETNGTNAVHVVIAGAYTETDASNVGVKTTTGVHLHIDRDGTLFTGDLELSDYKRQVLRFAPLRYWRLGEASGTSAADASGNAGTGTYVNTPTLDVSGVIPGDSAVTFTAASSERVDTGDLSAFEAGDCTYVGWIHKTDSSVQSVFSEGGAGSLNGYSALNASTAGIAQCKNDAGTTYTVTGGITVNDGKWHMVALVKRGTTLSLVVDAVQDGTPVTIAGTFTQDKSRIGNLGRSTESQYFNGTIDEVAVYTRALSMAELAVLFDAGLAAA
jgi:hypothetical protein